MKKINRNELKLEKEVIISLSEKELLMAKGGELSVQLTDRCSYISEACQPDSKDHNCWLTNLNCKTKDMVCNFTNNCTATL